MIGDIARNIRDFGFELLTMNKKTVTVHDVVMSLDGVSRRMRYVMARGYESRDAALALRFLVSSDRVLEAGGAIGFMALNCMMHIGIRDYCVVEANPYLATAISENFRLNGMTLPALRTAAVGPTDGSVSFGVSRNFWSSSVLIRDNEMKRITVPMLSIPTIVAGLPFQPNTLIMDIEGAEISIPPQHFDGFEKIIVELHPKLVGVAAARGFERNITSRGYVELARIGGTIAYARAT
jgi:FkbM family methyltransferase